MATGRTSRQAACLFSAVFACAALVSAYQVQDSLLLVREEIFRATISAIEDGDSVTVHDGQRDLRVHLEGIDAPELSQPNGADAKAFLTTLAAGQRVIVRVTGRAPAGGESFARLEVKGSDLSVTLLRSGMAWYCARHAEDAELARAERAAREAKRGLWSAPNSTAPWQYRGTTTCYQEKKGV